MEIFTGEKFLPKSICVLLASLMIANSVLFALLLAPQNAHAIFGAGDIVFDPALLARSIIDYIWQAAKWTVEKAGQLATTAYQTWEKFYSQNGEIATLLRGLFVTAVTMALNKLTNDIVAWINGGGKGKIAVLQNPEKFLANAANQAGGILAGEILGVDPRSLCDASFLQGKLKIAFTSPYAVPTFQDQVACTFTGFVDGLQKFQQDFRNGGWASFVQLTDMPNNHIGLTLLTAQELAQTSATQQAAATVKALTGQGFVPQELCTVTKDPQNTKGLQGRTVPDITNDRSFNQTGLSEDDIKQIIVADGGAVDCEAVTPASVLKDISSKALTGPMDQLKGTIDSLTQGLGTNVGSFIAPYLKAIAAAGLNQLVKQGKGLISDALARAQSQRKTPRQPTQSFQQNTQLASSAGQLSGASADFRSYLLNAALQFSLFISDVQNTLQNSNALGYTSVNRANVDAASPKAWEKINCIPNVGCGYLGPGDPGNPTATSTVFGFDDNAWKDTKDKTQFNPDDYPVGGYLGGTPYPIDDTNGNGVGGRVNFFTYSPGRIFYEEAQWCGAYAQEIPINGIAANESVVAPLYTPAPLPCSGSATISGLPAGVCNGDWMVYGNSMASRIIPFADAFNTTSTDDPTRWVRQSIVGPINQATGLPGAIPALDPANINFTETIIDTNRDTNEDGIVSAVATSSASLFQLSPNYTSAIYNNNSAPAGNLSVAIAQSAMATVGATTYLFGGVNQFGFSNRVIDGSGNSFATLPVPLAGASAVYYPPNGRVYIFGGYNEVGLSKTVYEFTPSTKQFKIMSAQLPLPSYGFSAAYFAANQRIYLFGGNQGGTVTDQILEYNEQTDTLVAKNAKLPSTLAFSAAIAAQGKIVVVGGQDAGGFYQSSMYIYDPAAQDNAASAIKTASSHIYPSAYLTMLQGSALNYINIYGGQNELGFVNVAEQFDMTLDRIGALPTALPAKESKMAVGAGGNMYGGIAEYPTGNPNAILYPQGDIYFVPGGFLYDQISLGAPGFSSCADTYLGLRYERDGDIGNLYVGGADAGYAWGGGVCSVSPEKLVASWDWSTMSSPPTFSATASGLSCGNTITLSISPGMASNEAYDSTALTAPCNPLTGTLSFDINQYPGVRGLLTSVPVFEKYYSAKFQGGSASLLTVKRTAALLDPTFTVTNPQLQSQVSNNPNEMFLSYPFYPELYEKGQELMEKVRIINGYNYANPTVKNYTASLSSQLGSVPDDDPYDNNPQNPFYNDQYDSNGILIEKGYKGSINDVLTKYTDLVSVYQTLFAGVQDENALEGVDKNFTILTPEEQNMKLALIGERCPALPPSATSTPDLLAKCPVLPTGEYNMANKFIFEPDDTGKNPTGLTTGFATNPFTGEKSSSLAGVLNLDDMANQLQSLPPDKNIIELIRLRQILEQLQVASHPIPMPGKVGVAMNPQPLSGTDVIQVSLPDFDKIRAWLNATSTTDALGNTVPLKNESIQDLIVAYGYNNAKDAYPEISKDLDTILVDITTQISDKLKDDFLKRIELETEQAREDAQYRLSRFIIYARDLNPVVKLQLDNKHGKELQNVLGSNIVKQIATDQYVLMLDGTDLFKGAKQISAILSRSPQHVTDQDRNGIIGSAIYKIKAMLKFVGFDTTTPDFQAKIVQYAESTSKNAAQDIDGRIQNALMDAFMTEEGIYDLNTDSLTAQQRASLAVPVITSADDYANVGCGTDTSTGVPKGFCNLTLVDTSGRHVRIFKDVKTKLEELNSDFSQMSDEVISIETEFQTLISDAQSQQRDVESLQQQLGALIQNYNDANSCFGLDTSNPWQPDQTITSVLGNGIRGLASGANPFSASNLVSLGLSLATFNLASILTSLISSLMGFLGGGANHALIHKIQKDVNVCRLGMTNYDKHLGQLADSFLCGKENPTYADKQ